MSDNGGFGGLGFGGASLEQRRGEKNGCDKKRAMKDGHGDPVWWMVCGNFSSVELEMFEMIG